MGWNFHFQLAKYARYIFVSSLFHLFCNIAVGFCLHTSWRLGQKPLHQKMPFDIRPKISHTNVQLSFISHIHLSPWSLVSQDLKRGLNSYIMTYLQSLPFCMINCVEDRISLRNYTYLVSVIKAIHVISSWDPKIIVSINCILLLLVIELIAM